MEADNAGIILFKSAPCLIHALNRCTAKVSLRSCANDLFRLKNLPMLASLLLTFHTQSQLSLTGVSASLRPLFAKMGLNEWRNQDIYGNYPPPENDHAAFHQSGRTVGDSSELCS